MLAPGATPIRPKNIEGVTLPHVFTMVRKLVEDKACIVDVREKTEYEAGHIIDSVNIPLSELRNRMDEIPKDRPVYLHCRSSQRSYNAIMELQGQGFENLYNIFGSWAVSIYDMNIIWM